MFRDTKLLFMFTHPPSQTGRYQIFLIPIWTRMSWLKTPPPPGSPLRRHRRRRHIPYLLDQKLPLINKLLVIGPILEKVRQEL